MDALMIPWDVLVAILSDGAVSFAHLLSNLVLHRTGIHADKSSLQGLIFFLLLAFRLLAQWTASTRMGSQ